MNSVWIFLHVVILFVIAMFFYGLRESNYNNGLVDGWRDGASWAIRFVIDHKRTPMPQEAINEQMGYEIEKKGLCFSGKN